MKTRMILLLVAMLCLSGCNLASVMQGYNSHVASRSDSISGFSNSGEGSYGAAYTHTVTYSPK